MMAAELAHPWVAAHSDGSGVYVFPTELEALRYAVAHGIDDVRQMVEWGRVWPELPAWSEDRVPQPEHDVSEGDDDRGEPAPAPAPVPLDRERIDALPVGSVIADKDGDTVERRADAWHRMTTYGVKSDVPLIWSGAPSGTYGPYTLVSMPEPERPLQVGDRVRVRDDVDHPACRGVEGTLTLLHEGMYEVDGHWGPLGDFERIPVD